TRILGVLNVFRERGHRFDKDALALATNLAEQAGVAIENARLYAESVRRQRAAESLAEVGRIISQSLYPREVAERMVASVGVLLDSSVASFHRGEGPDGDLVTPAVAGDVGPAWPVGTRIPAGVGAAGLAVRHGRPVTTDDLLDDPRIATTADVRARFQAVGMRVVLCVPILYRGQSIGAISVGRPGGRSFQEDEVR